jgi:aminoglycoside 3-N-acetyltransferase
MLRKAIARVLGDKQKRALKSRINQAKQRFVRTWFSYDADQLTKALRGMGLTETDTVLVHSNFEPDSGFKGAPVDLVNALATFLGERGNLLMVSIPFRGSAYDYLALNKKFDVRKTLSMMGLVTEIFRRRTGTRRSLHPTHPVLALGKDAEWLTAGHEDCRFPCGPGTPFEKFHQLNGKILFFDVGFGAITFFHHVEHSLQGDLPFPVYDERLFDATVVDASGQQGIVQTHAYSKVPRSAEKLEAEMTRRGKIRKGRVGNSRMLLVTAADVVTCQSEMVKAGNYPYDVPAATTS